MIYSILFVFTTDTDGKIVKLMVLYFIVLFTHRSGSVAVIVSVSKSKWYLLLFVFPIWNKTSIKIKLYNSSSTQSFFFCYCLVLLHDILITTFLRFVLFRLLNKTIKNGMGGRYRICLLLLLYFTLLRIKKARKVDKF